MTFKILPKFNLKKLEKFVNHINIPI